MTFEKLEAASEYFTEILEHPQWGTTEIDWNAIDVAMELIGDEIKRLSVTDEDVKEAIQEMTRLYQVIQDKFSFDESKRKAVKLAIEALKAYRPVRKSRTTEPVGESEPCYTCKQIEDKYETEVIIRYGFGDYEDFTPDYCPSCGRQL